jgi:hypothetical protein
MDKNFAEIDENNKVIRVIIAESKEWCELNLKGTWVETIDNGIENPRANIGDIYNPLTNEFIEPVIKIEEKPEV